MTSRNATALAMVAAAGMATSAFARPNFPEIEPNETKAQALANGPFTMVAGDTLSGNTTGTSTTVAGAASADTFLVKTGALPLGIYRHRLTITTTGTTGHIGTIRGWGQTAAVAGPWPGPVGVPTTTDTAVQTSSTATTPARMNQWYGFGKQEQIYYRVTGVAATTADYTATLTTDPVTPLVIPSAFEAGTIAIDFANQGHTTDTDMWIYDSSLNAIAGYGDDDRSLNSGSPYTTTALQSYLKRTYAAGTYFMAVSTFQAQNNLGSPCDDNFRTGTMLDFPDAQSNSSTTANVNVAFQMVDANGAANFPLTRVDAFGVAWVQFTVGTGITGACCKTDGTCAQISFTACASAGGVYNGDGTSCGSVTCPPGFACCLPNGSCATLTQAACTAQSGVWNNGMACGQVVCPQPGACCLADGSCQAILESKCTIFGGVFRGEGTLCGTANCVASDMVYMNGTLATGATTAGNGTVGGPGVAAPAGSQWSEVQDDGSTTCSNTSAGFTVTGVGPNGAFRIGDDFVVTNPQGVRVDAISFYAYLTGSTTAASPFNGATMRIWNGKPGDSTSTVIFGDTSTNRLISSTFANLFRVFNTVTPSPGTAPGTTRPIYSNLIGAGTLLLPGTYWFDVQLNTVTAGASAFAPTNTVIDNRTTPGANALQEVDGAGVGTWVLALDGGNPANCGAGPLPQDFPYVVKGKVIPAACYANCDNSTLPPCLNVNDFNCFLNAYSAGDAYANCDSSTLPPILNVNDFQCFLNAYSASCADPCAAH